MENGTDVPGHSEPSKPVEFYLNDPFRVNYYQLHLSELLIAMRQYNIPVTGYMAWSLEDNFEWVNGYAKKFGMTYIDRPTLRRYPKMSFYWYRELIRNQPMLSDIDESDEDDGD